MKKARKRIYIAIPCAFLFAFIVSILLSVRHNEDSFIGIGFVFGLITMPTSLWLNILADHVMKHEVPIWMQYFLIAVAGLINIGLIEIAHNFLFAKRTNETD